MKSKKITVVAIGASAGGIEPLRRFFARVEPSSGSAFVVIQHLGKDHQSFLPDLLADKTGMKVVAAAEGMSIEEDHVYVIPAGVALTLHDGRLHTEDLGRRRTSRNVINRFFKSLAHDCGPRAVCVILSGMGADGMLGARAVKEQGGMVVVQTPESARYNSMPESAIASGLADMVLEVDEMPAAITAVGKRYRTLYDKLNNQDQDARLAGVFTELNSGMSKEFGHMRRPVLVSRIAARMALRQVDILEDYVRLLSEDDREAGILVRNLLVGTSRFFADTDAFDVLEKQILPELIARKRKSDAFFSLRCWVAGCATGEEAYTLAMVIREALERAGIEPPVQVFATDFDEQTLAEARRGFYADGVAEELPEYFLDKYFSKVNGGYRIREEIRSMCVFSQHDLIGDPPYSRTDVVVCRNFLQACRGSLQRRLLSVLGYSLNTGGYLLLGTSEDTSAQPDMFQALPGATRLYQAVEHHRPAMLDFLAERQSSPTHGYKATRGEGSPEGDDDARRVENELENTREYLHSTSEALGIANEELRTSNEELRAMNEELQTANEELRAAREQQQILNRDLVNVNAMLRRKIEELDVAASDLHNFYESTRIPILFLDNDLALKKFTPAAVEFLGVSEEDVGKPTDKIERYFDGVDVAAEARDVIDNFKRKDIEVVHGQSGRHHVMQLRLYRTLNNVIEGVTVSFFDVDDFKKVKSDLHIRERMLRLVTDAVPMLIAYVDTNWVYRYCNAAYRSWFGLEKEEVVGRKVVEVLGDEVFDTIRPYFNRALAGEPVLYTETLDLPKLGRRTLRVNYEPHVDNNRVKGLIVFVQDESERIQRARKLGRLAAIVNSSHEVIIGKNTEGVITDWNRGAEELFGYSDEEAVGAHAFLTVPLEKREELAALHERLLKGETIEPFETVRLAKDGRRIAMLMSLSLIRSEEGEVLGMSAVAHDVTDRVEAERRLAELNEYLEKRVAERTAQLRNLAARLLSLEQAERRRFSRLLHDEIQQTLAAAKMLVEKSYGLSQAQARPSLSESLRLLSEAMEQARIITTELSPPLFFETGLSVCLQWIMRWAETKFSFFVNITVEGEERPIADETGYFLYRSIRELLFNSYKHGSIEQADVTALFKDDGTLVVSVEDRGVGFDPGRINTPANEHFGVLSIIEQIRAMGGGVEIISKPGEGARTVLTLPPGMIEPAVEEETPREVKEALLADNRQQVEAGGAKPVILIVDDQEDLRFTLRLMLEELSSRYTFVEAEDGLQALDMVREYDPQLVLMDISMPGMSGVETTKRVKELKEEVVVIGLSMHEREDMEAAMRKAGAAGYITKDSASEAILEMIEKFLQEKD